MTILPSVVILPGSSRPAFATISGVAAGKNSVAANGANCSSVTRPTL